MAMTNVTAFETARYVWRYWVRFPRTFAMILTGVVCMTLIDAAVPVVTGRFVDAIASDAAPRDVWTGLLMVLGFSAAFFSLRFVILQVWLRFAVKVMRAMVGEVFERVQRFSSEWHANAFAGATVRKISRGMWAYDTFADTSILALGSGLLTLVFLTGMLTLHWPQLGGAVAILIALHLAGSYLLATRYVAPASHVHMAADSRIGATMSDAISCNPVVKSFGAEAREDAVFHGVMRDWGGKAVIAWGRQEKMIAFQCLVQVGLMGMLLGMVTLFWSQGQATPGDVVLALTTSFIMDGQLRHSTYHIRNLQQAVNELEDMVLFARMPIGVPDKPKARTFQPGRGDIRFENVRFAYANQPDPIYDRFSLAIEPGERVGLVGRSGAGKSTFVKLLQRLHDLDAGRILIDGQDIAMVTQASLRQSIALVPQDPALFHRTLAENIAYAKPDATRADIVEAAKRAHADEFIRTLPLGYDTEVGERGVKLSGGERQRVALARAFLADAPILVLDEATSSLDSETELLIQDAMEELMRGRTTILIAHRLSTLRDVDRILVFDKGRIVEQGRQADLLAKPQGLFKSLHETQAAGLIF